ncbi:MAG: ABC transporter permease [Bacteroidota bacterium]|nr:ABC transporter permease [Bacteroidota bacterium]
MLRIASIVWNSFKMSLQELANNKLRSALSLLGVAFGIFCIIGVLAAVDSMERKLQSDVKSLGSNTIYVDKWEYSGGPDYPWWKFVNRPSPNINELKFIQKQSTLAANVAYFNQNISVNLSYGNSQLTGVNVYAVSEDYNKIQSFNIAYGRYINQSEFQNGSPVVVIGNKNAELLFGSAEKAEGKVLNMDGRHVQVVGVIEKQGSSMIGGFDYDQCVIISYQYFASVWDVNNRDIVQPAILVNSKPDVPTTALMDELRGIMRQVRKLSPTAEDNFALNDVSTFSNQISSFFGSVDVGGWAIAGLSLIVGAFGVANIMFVTVRERTSQIGLKKAIGAKSITILTEFLLESAFLCILGGLFGLLLVYLLSLVLTTVLPFPVIIAPHIIVLAFSICVVLGIVSGIIPARTAAKMNPVEAIRSK